MDNSLYDHEIDAFPVPPPATGAVIAPVAFTKSAQGKPGVPWFPSPLKQWVTNLSLPLVLALGLLVGLTLALPLFLWQDRPNLLGIGLLVGLLLVAAPCWMFWDRFPAIWTSWNRLPPIWGYRVAMTFLGLDLALFVTTTRWNGMVVDVCVELPAVAALAMLVILGVRAGWRVAFLEGLRVPVHVGAGNAIAVCSSSALYSLFILIVDGGGTLVASAVSAALMSFVLLMMVFTPYAVFLIGIDWAYKGVDSFLEAGGREGPRQPATPMANK